jgi:hypothetical protein
MDRRYIDDHHVVARYLADQLADAEREAFENYFIQHPETVKELEAAARFKIGLMQLRDSGELNQLLQPSRPKWWHRPFAAAAAVAIVAIALSTFLLPQPAPLLVTASSTLVNRRGTPLPIAARYTILRTRGATSDAEVTRPSKPHAIELRVLPEYETEPARYRLSLSRLDGDQSHEVAALEGLIPEDDGFVRVAMNSERLIAGRYRIELSGDAGTSAAASASTFLIRVRDAAAER